MAFTNPAMTSARTYLQERGVTGVHYGLRGAWFIALPKRELLVSLPASHDGSYQSSQQSSTVKEHVEGIRYEPQAVGPHAIEQLHKGKGEIEEEEEEEVPSGLL